MAFNIDNIATKGYEDRLQVEHMANKLLYMMIHKHPKNLPTEFRIAKGGLYWVERNRRQRKKMKIEEFTEEGFTLTFVSERRIFDAEYSALFSLAFDKHGMHCGTYRRNSMTITGNFNSVHGDAFDGGYCVEHMLPYAKLVIDIINKYGKLSGKVMNVTAMEVFDQNYD